MRWAGPLGAWWCRGGQARTAGTGGWSGLVLPSRARSRPMFTRGVVAARSGRQRVEGQSGVVKTRETAITADRLAKAKMVFLVDGWRGWLRRVSTCESPSPRPRARASRRVEVSWGTADVVSDTVSRRRRRIASRRNSLSVNGLSMARGAAESSVEHGEQGVPCMCMCYRTARGGDETDGLGR